VTDGSISYQKQIQQAIDTAARDGRMLAFTPMTYRLDESGLQLRSGSRLWLYGAVLQFGAECKRDGHAFVGRDVRDVQLLGGEIVGRNDAWPEGVNIRGIYITGQSENIRIRDLHVRYLSSNGIGLFGDAQQSIRDAWVTDVVIEHCCNRYGDYLSDRVGPEPGSVREDQGLIAFYYVQDFIVRGCRLEKSRSDGTHFYRCRQGQFLGNKVYAAQMGGYFIESCEDILASDNVIRDNGSRGCTIECGSKNCILSGNLVANSGREGLWAPDCTGRVITGNNGRKPNGTRPHQVWNANITVNEDRSDPTKSPTQDYLIAHNVLYTTPSQPPSQYQVFNTPARGPVLAASQTDCQRHGEGAADGDPPVVTGLRPAPFPWPAAGAPVQPDAEAAAWDARWSARRRSVRRVPGRQPE
jgi:hypothetical protein